MKAFLLAAGKGTRLKPYTDAHPKCLIPIHGTPLLQIWIDLLAQHGISEVLINTHHHADQVEQFVKAYQRHTDLFLRTVYEPRLRGSAGTLLENRNFVADQSDFLIAYADNLTNLNLLKMIDFHRKIRSMKGVLTMGLIKAPNPSACGIVTLDHSEKIIKFVEKPFQPESDLANAGVYIAANEVFDFFPAVNDVAGLKDEVLDLGHHLLPLLAGKMYGYHISAYLKDIGTPEAYEQALVQWAEVNNEVPGINGIK